MGHALEALPAGFFSACACACLLVDMKPSSHTSLPSSVFLAYCCGRAPASACLMSLVCDEECAYIWPAPVGVAVPRKRPTLCVLGLTPGSAFGSSLLAPRSRALVFSRATLWGRCCSRPFLTFEKESRNYIQIGPGIPYNFGHESRNPTSSTRNTWFLETQMAPCHALRAPAMHLRKCNIA